MGIGLVYLSAVVIVQTYFKKKRAFAGSIASCGTGVGVLAMAPIVSLLDASLGWGYAMMILGALNATSILFAMSFRPLAIAKYERSEKSCNEKKKVESNHDNVTDNIGKSNFMTLILQKIRQPSKVLYNPVFITCFVANILMNIGYLVPYVYTVVSMKIRIMQINIQLHFFVTQLESCH